MKNLIAIILVFGSLSASAATMTHISKMSDSRVESYTQTFSKLKPYWSDDVGQHILKVRFTSKKSSQSWSKAFRQAIYYFRAKLWGKWSVPEDVGISSALKSPAELRSAIESSLSYAEIPQFDRMVKALYYKAGRTKAKRNYIQFYEGGDGNTFGNCNWLMIMDYRHKEAAYMSGCYAE